MRSCVVLCLSIACAKADDVGALRQQATELGASAQAQVDALDARMQAVIKRGLKLTRRLPGTDDAGKLVRDTSNELAQLHAGLDELGRERAEATTRAAIEPVINTYNRLTGDRPELELGSGDIQIGSGPQPITIRNHAIRADGAALSTVESWVTHAEAEMRDGDAVPVSQ